MTAVPDQYLQQAIRLLDEAVLSSSDGIRSLLGEVMIVRARMREKGCYRASAPSENGAPKSLDQRGTGA